MNCIECKHYKIKFNSTNILDNEYCNKFGCHIKTLKEKIETKNIDCFEKGKNSLTEYKKEYEGKE